MEYTLFVVLLLILYLVRDAELLRMSVSAGGSAGRRIVLYGVSIGLVVMTAASVTPSLDLDLYLWRIRQPDVVKPLLGVQLGIWFYYAWLRRTGDLPRLWTVAVVPSPVLVLSLVGLAVFGRSHHVSDSAILMALTVVMIWIGSVTLWTRWIMAASGDDPAWSLGFVGVSHCLIVVLLPFENILAEAQNLMRTIFAHA